MAVSSTASRNPNRDRIIRNALHTCGALHASHSPDADQVALGAEYLSDGLTALQAEGVILQTLEWYTQTITSGTGTYSAPSGTESIEDGAFATDSTGLDHPLELVDARVYRQGVADKETEGQPYWYYPQRTPTGWTITLFNVPDANWASFTYPRVRQLRDVDTGAVTLDLPPKWAGACEWFLAWKFACHYKLPLDRCAYFESQWQAQKARLLDDEGPRGPSRFVMEPLFAR